MIASGTTPPGASNERQAAAWVQQMFADVAPKYDFLNHLLSFNIDRRWRRILMRHLRPILDRRDAIVLDLCCGTADVLLDLRSVSAARIVGADFCHPMLVAAHEKITRLKFTPLLIEGDALQLPLAADSLDAVAISFGFRNLSNYSAGLRELHRILTPGGVLAILEFSHPPGLFIKVAYGVYSKVIMPLVGAAISGSPDAYTYLPESIRKFPRAPQLAQMMQEAGFSNARFELLTGGIAALHLGEKSPAVAVAPF
ncbi:MAG TPA: bifunctional demethylmenaquinone methyltransferase/2-methoxy-6-polyprenyl-1,4-benzoquinol methylase UbiE [Bryobacteraceae bacterium]|nr:bifunctional demethylmenaquinone methyltransferase/2-methoxy-6-polyprenyl-1,4-benzoquinol methylase UbiE [Bryobacteraceae bacterium]